MRPLILLTNDDGIYAPGILTLCKAMEEADLGDLIVVAPASEKSGIGAAITWDRPMHVQKIDWENKTEAWSVDGTPADCVKMGERVILKRKPDLIVAGINAGSNAGRNVLHSGTIGAVIEGAMRGIAGIAFSCENGKKPNYHVAEKYIGEVVRYHLENPLPAGSILNVNFPHAAQDVVAGFRMTRQGRGRWAENPYLHIESLSGASYWLGGKPEELDEEYPCDISYLREGYMTAVPLQVNELTDHNELKKGHKTFESYFLEKNLL